MIVAHFGSATITNTEQARLPDGQGMSNVEVFDIYGRLVPFNFDVQRSLLDIRYCPAGIYFVKLALSGVEGAGGAVRKLVKR